MKPSRAHRAVRRGARLVAVAAPLFAAACGGTTQFEAGTPIAVYGDPPPPPPQEAPPARVVVRDNQIEITEKIQFEKSKSRILEESFSLLDEIAKVIKENPHIKKIRVEGHASSEGDLNFNRTLSANRARSVRQYLVEHGIPEDKLVAEGFGIDRPIASNDTPEGREKNRRVEFNIIEQDVTKRKVEIGPDGKERVVSIVDGDGEASAPKGDDQ